MVLFCRLCLGEDPKTKLKNVFQCTIQHAEDSLVDVLFWVFSVEIDVTDPFSKNICTECIQLIEYILQVKNTFQQNQESLRDFLQNRNCASLDDSLDKVSNNEQESSPYCTTPTNSPTKCRSNLKSPYGSSSPRVRVSLSAMESICPLNVGLVQLENTQEYLRYKRLKNGSFKKRKYRHFKMDEALLDDICNTLDDRELIKTEPLKKDIGVSTEYSLLSKAINTDGRNICTCNKIIVSPLKKSASDGRARNLLRVDKLKPETDALQCDDDFSDILGFAKNVGCTRLSPDGDKEYDWTTLTFKKDASTNTNALQATRSIGVDAIVPTTTTGTLTKVFKQMRKKNIVKVDINSLESFCPKVILEPLEDILKKTNYRQIDTFKYIQENYSTSESETEKNLEGNMETEMDDSPKGLEGSKTQKFLDYYKNFSSFAVRELITGKKIRDSDNETSPVYKISNVCSVFVCDFCSKSFLSKITLDEHYKKAHKTRMESDEVQAIDLEKSDNKTPTSKNSSPRRMKEQPRSLVGSPQSNNVMKKKLKPVDNVVVDTKKKKTFYAWDRKGLGKYSAISYYRNYSCDEQMPVLDIDNCNVKPKKDMVLNNTIQKLVNRLDGSGTSTVDMCDNVNVNQDIQNVSNDEVNGSLVSLS